MSSRPSRWIHVDSRPDQFTSSVRRASARSGVIAALGGLLIGGAVCGTAAITAGAAAETGSRPDQLPVGYRTVPSLSVVLTTRGGEESEGGVAGNCPPQIASHTNSDFGPGTYILQGGFAEQEIAAASYTLPASAFPIQLDLAEFFVGTSNATGPTITEWSFLVWEGKPSAGNQPIVVFSSQDGLVPPIQTSFPTQGVKIEVFVDPTDPEQIVIFPNADNAFTIGLRIDQHNAQTSNPCFTAPPSCCNAFPATDVDGLQAPSENWIFAVDCIVCPGGWSSFQSLPSFCRPSGDWVMRATWSSVECEPVVTGACCLGTSCSILSQANCVAAGGTFLGGGEPCTGGICQPQTVPCCFQGTGGCINLLAADCAAAGGVVGPAGVSCAIYTCFPIGACCLPNGSCEAGLSPAECELLNGAFQGSGTDCSIACPEPLGACCFATGFCLVLTEAQCGDAGATWAGPGTNCLDGNGNGQADACEPPSGNPADLNDDGIVDGADLGILLAQWGNPGSADLNGNGTVDGADLGILLAAWTPSR